MPLPILAMLALAGGGFATGLLGEKARKKQEAETFKQRAMLNLVPEMLKEGINPFDDTDFAKQAKGTPVEGLAPVFDIIAKSTRKSPQFQARQALLTEGGSPGGPMQMMGDESQGRPAEGQYMVETPFQKGTPRSPEAVAAAAAANPALAAIAGPAFADVARIGMDEKRAKREDQRHADAMARADKDDIRADKREERQAQTEERMASQWQQTHALAVRSANQQASYQAASLAIRRSEIGAAKAERAETNMRIARGTVAQWAEAGAIKPAEVESTVNYLATGRGKLPDSIADNADAKRYFGQVKVLEDQSGKLQDDAAKIRIDLIGNLKSDKAMPIESASDETHRLNTLLARDYNARIQFHAARGNKAAVEALRSEAFGQLGVLVQRQGAVRDDQPMLVSAESAKEMIRSGATLVGRDPGTYIVGGFKADGSVPSPQESVKAFEDSYLKVGGQVEPKPSGRDTRILTQEEADAKIAAHEQAKLPRKENLIRAEAPKMLKGASSETIEEYVQLRMGGMSAAEAVRKLK